MMTMKEKEKSAIPHYGRRDSSPVRLPFNIVYPARNRELSIEPLLLNEPYEKTVEEQKQRSAQKDGKGPKAIYLFTVILLNLLVIVVIGQLLYSFGPSLLSSLASAFGSLATVFGFGKAATGKLLAGELQNVVNLFEAFERQFERAWTNDWERLKRFKIFERNLHEIDRLNAESEAKGRSVRYGINGMADTSEEELRQMLLPMDHFKKRRQNAQFIQTMNPILRRAYTAVGSGEAVNASEAEYPSHFDWRDKGVVTPVKAQGLCGSCWAFAAVATTESAYAVAHGKLRSLSEQELLDCNLENNACKGGNEDKAFRFIHERGLVSEWEYPYVAHRQNVCRMNEKSDNLTKIDVAVFINPDEQSMLDWLINFGPVNVGIAVPPDMKPYISGIYHPSDYDCKFRVVGLHALLVVGYGVSDDGDKYWIVKNSWGNTWGQEHGYVNFIRGMNACGIEDEPVGLLA